MIEIKKYEGKNKEEVLNNVLNDLNCTKEELYVKESETTGGLFKGKKVILSVIKKQAVVEQIKTIITEITKQMNISTQIEIREKDDVINVLLMSDNNQILIGKNGKNLDALQTIVRQAISNITDMSIRIIVDISNYKDKKVKNLEYTIKKVAREVLNSGIEAKLDAMNSYERRIVHTVVSDFNDLETESEGDEPNRYVIIKRKEK